MRLLLRPLIHRLIHRAGNYFGLERERRSLLRRKRGRNCRRRRHAHHGYRLAVESAGDMIAEVLDDNLHLLRDVVGMQPHPAGKRLGGLGSIDLLIVVGRGTAVARGLAAARRIAAGSLRTEAERLLQTCRRLAGLARVRLIGDHREGVILHLLTSEFFEHLAEGLNRDNDNRLFLRGLRKPRRLRPGPRRVFSGHIEVHSPSCGDSRGGRRPRVR